MEDRSDLDFDYVILVTRGDELPKRNFEKKKHPTYETSIRIKYSGQAKVMKPHLVVKFFNQYRDLYEALQRLGVGENLKIHVDAAFPPSHKSSLLGMGLTEDQLQERCYLLNKWVQAVFSAFHLFSPEGQKIISEFLSLDDDDTTSEANKELILSLLRRKHERDCGTCNTGASVAVPTTVGAGVVTTSTAPTGGALGTSTTTEQPFTAPQLTSSNSVSPTKSAPMAAAPPLDRRASTGRVISSKFSVVSEAPMLSGAEMEEYSKENVLQYFLAVSVLRGEMIPKSKEETKLHHSYETILRVLSLNEALSSDASGQLASTLSPEVDADAYEAMVASVPPLSVAQVFDGYRQLMTELEDLGVFPKDHAYKAQTYEEDENTRRRAVVIDGPFPKTFRRSSLGMGLTEMQLQTRMVMLNNWMGHLLRGFPQFPADAQQLVLKFIGLSADSDSASQPIITMLKGTYQLPKKLPPPPPPAPTILPSSNSMKKNSAAAKEEQPVEPVVPQVMTAVTWQYALLKGPSAAPAADGIPEYMVNSFLGIKVGQGEKMLRKANDSKLHSSYEIRIRILSYSELTLPEKADMDVEIYQAMTRLPVFTVAKVFDTYRTLKGALEERRVVSRDRLDSNGSTGGCVVIDAVFPPTHGKSSLGIGLTDAEKQERASMLNVWMTALLARYGQCTPEAQELIRAFMDLEEDNPAEPQNKPIHAILKRTFRPQLKPPPPPPPAQKGGFLGVGGGSKGQRQQPGGANAQQQQPVAVGCACVIS